MDPVECHEEVLPRRLHSATSRKNKHLGTSMSVLVCTYENVRVCRRECACVHMYRCVKVCIHVSMFMCLHVYALVFALACVHT